MKLLSLLFACTISYCVTNAMDNNQKVIKVKESTTEEGYDFKTWYGKMYPMNDNCGVIKLVVIAQFKSKDGTTKFWNGRMAFMELNPAVHKFEQKSLSPITDTAARAFYTTLKCEYKTQQQNS